MGLENFTPRIWAASMLVRLRKTLVHAMTVNRDYEGEIRAYGDTVYINEISDVSVSNYTKNGTITWGTLDSAQKALLIDQAKSFNFVVDDIDRAQNRPAVMASAMDNAAYQIAKTVDDHLADLYVQAGNSVTALTVSVGAVLQNLSNMQLALDDADVPPEGRFLPIPPWYNQHLVMAATGAVSATGVPKVFDDGIIRNGYVGTLFGFDLLLTTNVDNNGTVWNLMGYHRMAITHAAQIASVEAVRPDDRFADGVKGLYLYGSKVVKPSAMVKCAATKG